MRYLPVSLDTRDKNILVLGGGYMAYSAIKTLAKTEATIYVIADIINDDIKKATARSLENIKEILQEAGSSLDKVVKVNIFLKDMNDFSSVNEVYSKYFTTNKPARSCVEVSKLPKDGIIEIEAVAEK